MHIKKTRQLLDELSSLIKSTNTIEVTKRYEPLINNCESILNESNKTYLIDIILYGNPSVAEKKLVENYFDQPLDQKFFNSEKGILNTRKHYNSLQLNLRFLKWNTIPSDYFENPKHITFCLLFADSKTITHVEQHIALLVENNVWTHIFSSTHWHSKEKELIKTKVGICHFHLIESLENQQMNEDLEQILNLRNHELGQAYIGMQYISNIYIAFSDSYQELKQRIAVKKMQLSQKMTHSQSNSKQNLNNRNDIKNVMSLRFGQFEERFKSVIEQSFSPPLGYIIQMAEQQAYAMEDLVETKKSKQMVYNIDPEFENSFLDNFRNYCVTIYIKEKKEGHKCVRTLEREFGKTLAKHGLELNVKQYDDSNESTINKLLQHKVYFDRPFEATTTNRGIMEYIMGARMYYMYIMMGASMLGFNIRFIPGGKQLLIPIAILLIGLGIFQVWSSKQSEKDDDQEKNLQKAQEFINTQSKKISQDISRLFEKLIAEEVRKKCQQLLIETERLIQEKQQSEQKKNDIEKNKIDRLLKNISNQERSLDMLSRNESTFERNLERLKQDFQSALKPARTLPPASRSQPKETKLQPRAARPSIAKSK